jgi:hypothetical protein
MPGFTASMSECLNPCPVELAGLNVYDSPIVADGEWICRTVRPDDLGAKNTLKNSFIQSSSLLKGELSAWRISNDQDLPELEQKLIKQGTPPDNIVAATAGAIRAVRLAPPARVFSVVNDTRIDDLDNHDQQHVAIAPCAQLMNSSADQDALISELKTNLKLVFLNSGVSLKKLGSS